MTIGGARGKGKGEMWEDGNPPPRNPLTHQTAQDNTRCNHIGGMREELKIHDVNVKEVWEIGTRKPSMQSYKG